MNENEMIEEMAQEIFNTCAWRFGKPNDYKEICKDIAEDLIKLGYTKNKLPEGSVVLDRHEAQKYFAYKHIEPQIKGCLDREQKLQNEINNLKTELKQARKETAKEFADIVYKTLTDQQIWKAKQNWWLQNGECFELKDFLKQILKQQFGVEVE